jgi:glycyl-tRNA synthetase beta chain
MHDPLLIELLTEELPPKSLDRLGRVFGEYLYDYLSDERFIPGDTTRYEVFATPRRLGVLFPAVLDKQPDRNEGKKGPSVSSAIDANGNPSERLLGFAKRWNVSVDELERSKDEKGEFFFAKVGLRGETLEAKLSELVEKALKQLPIPKLMRWGERDTEFVRPIHALVMLHGDRVVPGKVLGVASGDTTRGHRFLTSDVLTIPHAHDYVEILADRGKVIVRFGDRKEMIREELRKSCVEGTVYWDESLLDEVTALVEYPKVYLGKFDSKFLAVPNECLVLSMKQHQKYFPVLQTTDAPLRLLPRFLIVSNVETGDPKNIIAGNERVLRARLSDAQFFYDQDRKTRLADRVERLGAVVYHNKLGSQLDRVQRIRKLAGTIAQKLNADVEKAERAAWLAKADLLTDMVGEFPELQGVMGQYYALHDGESVEVARAIEAHYHPRFANDSLPTDNIGSAVALADKLDTLVGIYGVGLVPTGDKDPFGLRRQALGVVRILSERSLPLDLMEMLALAKLQFAPEILAGNVASGDLPNLHTFILERLRNYLRERGFVQDEIEAVVSQNPTRIDQVVPRLDAVQKFRTLPEAESLASANKRIQNLLKKTTVTQAEPNLAIFTEPAEKELYAATSQLTPSVSSLWDKGNYTEALRALAGVRDAVDTFFDQVMVMADDPSTRDNRLALLNQLGSLLNRVADISKLAK